MCVDPFTAIGIGLSLVGTMVQANAQMENARFQHQTAVKNAKAAQIAADENYEVGRNEIEKKQKAIAALISKQRVNMAANGIDVGSDDPLSMLDNTRELGDADLNAIAGNYKRQSQAFAQQSYNYAREGENALNIGKAQAFGTVLTGLAGASSKFGSYFADSYAEAWAAKYA